MKTERLEPLEENQIVVPRLRFPEFKDGRAWELVYIHDLCRMKAGDFIKASEILKNQSILSFPCYGGNGLRGYVNMHNFDGSYSLIGRQGAHCGNVRFVHGKFYATEHAIVVEPYPKVHKLFLFYILFGANLNQYATGQAQPGLSVDNIYNLSAVFVQNIIEQQKIADCLSSLDELIELHAQKLEALKTHKKGLMQQLFPQAGETMPRLRFPEFREVGAWEGKSLSKIVDKVASTLSHKDLQTESGFYPVYGASGVLTYTDFYMFDVDYIAVLKDGSGAGDIRHYKALSSITGTLEGLIVNSGYATFFVYSQLRLLDIKQFLVGGAIPHVYFKSYSSLYIQYPKLPEQQKIADCLRSLDEVIDLHTQKLEALKTHKKALMQQLFPST